MGCFSADAPATPNYGTVTQKTLQAQVDEAPAEYAAEASPSFGQPAYTKLALSDLGTLVNGMGNTLGLSALTATANTNQRQSDINDVTNLGPEATQAMLAADPYNATLLSKLNAQANAGLDAGSSLTDDQARAMQQQSRAAFAARGMGGGNASISDELLRQFNLGQQLQTQRQGFAQSVLGNNQAVLGDPFNQILGRNSGVIPAAQNTQSQSGPSLFNPQAGLGLAASNYASASQFAAANNPLATIGGVLGGVGQAAGGVGLLALGGI